jgi:hypothetical protein
MLPPPNPLQAAKPIMQHGWCVVKQFGSRATKRDRARDNFRERTAEATTVLRDPGAATSCHLDAGPSWEPANDVVSTSFSTQGECDMFA